MEESFALGNRDLSLLSRYGLDEQQLRNCSVRRYGFGEAIITENRPNERIYIIISGKVKVEITALNGKSVLLCFYVSEGLMGEMEFFAGTDYGCSCVSAVSELCCISIPIRANQTYLNENLTFVKNAASELARKLLQSSHSVMDHTLYPAEARLCRYILTTAQNGYFRDVMTNVACSIGVSYRHLYRMLDKLCKTGVIKRTKTGYQITDPEQLRKFCQ